MRNFFFTPWLARGYEPYALIHSMVIMMGLIAIGLSVTACSDLTPHRIGAASAVILAASVYWFTVRNHYRILASLFIGSGGFICFYAVYIFLEWPSLIMITPVGFATILRFFSEGPYALQRRT